MIYWINFLLLERLFYFFGSLVAFISGGIKLVSYFERPKIKLRANLFFDHKNNNEYGQEEIPLEYDCDLLNTGRDLIGELVLKKDFTTYQLGDILKLKKNIPKKIKGTINISPGGINIKEVKTPFEIRIFFQDINGKRYAFQKWLLDEGISQGSHTKDTL